MAEGEIEDVNGEAYNLESADLNQLWNSPHYERIRHQFANETWPKECRKCEIQEKTGGISKRNIANKKWLSRPEIRNLLTTPKALPYPIYIDLKPGNLCNLACRFCTPMSSSRLYQEFRRHTNKVGCPTQFRREVLLLNQQPDRWQQANGFWSQLARLSKHTQAIYFTGGEPLINPRITEYLLEYHKSNPQGQLETYWTTNLSYWNEQLFEILKNLKLSDFTVSVDATGNAYEYLRYPGSWDVLERNFERLLGLPENFEVSVCLTYQLYNLTEISSVLHWIDAKACEYRRQIYWHLNPLYHPVFLKAELAPANLKSQLREQIQRFIKNSWILKNYPGSALHLIKQLTAMLSFIEQPAIEQQERLLQFRDYNKLLDNSRKQEFAEVFPLLNHKLQEKVLA